VSESISILRFFCYHKNVGDNLPALDNPSSNNHFGEIMLNKLTSFPSITGKKRILFYAACSAMILAVPGYVHAQSDAEMPPMPTANQLDDSELSRAEPVQNNKGESVSVFYDSMAAENADMRRDLGPRKIDPRRQPGQKFIVVEKDAAADSQQSMLVAAERALKLGRNASALDIYEQLYKRNKRDVRILMGLAVAQQKSGLLESAVNTYEQILKVDADNVDAIVNMTGIIQKQYPSVALRKLLDLRKKYPQNPGIPAQIGLISASEGGVEQAMRYLGIASSMEPRNPSHVYNMAVISDQGGNYKQAIEFYEQALEIDAAYGSGREVPREVVYDRLAVIRRY